MLVCIVDSECVEIGGLGFEFGGRDVTPADINKGVDGRVWSNGVVSVKGLSWLF